MTDITMSIDDTLELDAVIKEWNDPNNIVSDDDNSFEISGFQKNTSVLNPQESGTHNITVNGQTLTVKVIDSTTIPNSAVYRWSSNEGSGSTLNESVNGNENLNLNGGYSWVESSSYTGGSAIDYNGSDSYATGGDIGDFFNSTGDFTFEIWLNIQKLNTEMCAFYHGWDNGSGAGSGIFNIGINKNDSSKFGFEWSAGQGVTADISSLSGLVQVVVTWDSSSSVYDMYFDNSIKVNSKSGSDNQLDSGSSKNGTAIGAKNNGSRNIDAVIDLVQIHDKYVSSSEVNTLYNNHSST